jgi:hypothetical protein
MSESLPIHFTVEGYWRDFRITASFDDVDVVTGLGTAQGIVKGMEAKGYTGARVLRPEEPPATPPSISVNQGSADDELAAVLGAVHIPAGHAAADPPPADLSVETGVRTLATKRLRVSPLAGDQVELEFLANGDSGPLVRVIWAVKHAAKMLSRPMEKFRQAGIYPFVCTVKYRPAPSVQGKVLHNVIEVSES